MSRLGRALTLTWTTMQMVNWCSLGMGTGQSGVVMVCLLNLKTRCTRLTTKRRSKLTWTASGSLLVRLNINQCWIRYSKCGKNDLV